MSATVVFSESNTLSETISDDIDNINLGDVDEPNIVPGSHKIRRGLNSYSKYIRVLFTGDFTEISNILLWKSSGDYKTGETLKAESDKEYATPSREDTEDDNIPTSEETALVLSAYEGGAVIDNATAFSGYTAYIRMQLQSSTSSPAGAVNQKTIKCQYDEV